MGQRSSQSRQRRERESWNGPTGCAQRLSVGRVEGRNNHMAVKTKVLALANKINAALSGGLIRIKPTDPEYRILEPVTSDEEAELALHLEVRKPMSVAEIAKRAKRDPAEVER